MSNISLNNTFKPLEPLENSTEISNVKNDFILLTNMKTNSTIYNVIDSILKNKYNTIKNTDIDIYNEFMKEYISFLINVAQYDQCQFEISQIIKTKKDNNNTIKRIESKHTYTNKNKNKALYKARKYRKDNNINYILYNIIYNKGNVLKKIIYDKFKKLYNTYNVLKMKDTIPPNMITIFINILNNILNNIEHYPNELGALKVKDPYNQILHKFSVSSGHTVQNKYINILSQNTNFNKYKSYYDIIIVKGGYGIVVGGLRFAMIQLNYDIKNSNKYEVGTSNEFNLNKIQTRNLRGGKRKLYRNYTKKHITY